jgi:hypothetical protein
MFTLFAKLRVMVGALPTWLAALTAVLTVVGTEIVPLLPGGWPVQAGGWVVVALAVLRTAGEVVARVTTVLPEQRGVLSPAGTRVETVTVHEVSDSGALSGP